MRDLVAGAVGEAHAAHVAQHGLEDSMRAFLSDAALSAIRALNGGGSPHAAPENIPGGECRAPATRGSPDGPLWVLDEVAHLQPVSSAPVDGRCAPTDRQKAVPSPPQQRRSLLHALRTHLSTDAAPYLNQARAT